jgi:lysophospholipase L1-like esterase
MKSMPRLFLKLSLVILFASCRIIANSQPFAGEIREFKKQDSLSFPSAGSILFVGSSSFNFWKDVNNYFPGYKIINRGFGGSSLPDLIRYADDIIFPYKPAQIVIYCGENDLAASDTVTAQMVFNRFKELFELIRASMGAVPIVFVSIKPSPSRQRLMPAMTETNKMIRKFLKKKKNTAFADVYPKMLNKDGTPVKEIFKEDQLHMNAKGYSIWQKVLQPYLLKPKQ